MHRPGEIKFDPIKVVSVFFNGTDTIPQPTGYLTDFYNTADIDDRSNGRSETISYVAYCVEPVYAPEFMYAGFDLLTQHCPELRTYTILEKDVREDPYYGPKIAAGSLKLNEELPNPKCRIIEGPNTLATNVHKKIAKGVVSILGSILNGKNIINLAGHSRGGVIPNEVAHELQRIKEAMCENPAETSTDILIKLICGDTREPGVENVELKVRNELTRIIKQLQDNISGTEFNRFLTTIRDKFAIQDGYHANCEEIWIECLIQADPVSGNTVLGAPGIGWVTPRMFKYPAIVRNAYVLRCANEDSACFDSTYATRTAEHTYVEQYLIPGHHGTLTGNEFGNNGETLEEIQRDLARITEPQELEEYSGLHTRDAQYLALYIIVGRLEEHGTKFSLEILDCPLRPKFTEYLTAPATTEDGNISRKQLEYNCYNQIMKNYKAYQLLNHTVYIKLGWRWHEAFEGANYHLTTKTRPVIVDANYNKTSLGELIRFKSKYFYNWQHLQLFMQLELGINPYIAPEVQLDKILSFDQELQTILNGEDNATEAIQAAIQSIVASLALTYISNNLSEDRKQAIIDVINKTLWLTIPDDTNHYEVDASISSSSSEVFVTLGQPTNLDKLKHSLLESLNTHIIQQISVQIEEQKANIENLFKDIEKARNPEAERNRIAAERDRIATDGPNFGSEDSLAIVEGKENEEELQELQLVGEYNLIKVMLENNLPSLINRYFEILSFTKHLQDLSAGIELPDSVNSSDERKARIESLQQDITNSANALNDYAIQEIGSKIQDEIMYYVRHHRDTLDNLVYKIRQIESLPANAEESPEELDIRKNEALQQIIHEISNKYFELQDSIRKLRQLRNNAEYTSGLTIYQSAQIKILLNNLRQEVQKLDDQLYALPTTIARAAASINKTIFLKAICFSQERTEFNQKILDACRVQEDELCRQDQIIVRQQEDLLLQSTEISNLQARFNMLDEINERQKLESERKNEVITQQREDLTQRDATIAHLQEDLTQRDATIAHLQEDLTQRDATIAHLQEDLTQKDATLSAKQLVAANYQQASFKPSISFHIVNGFILALGIAAVALAVAILLSQPLTAAAIPAAIIGTVGLCATGLGLYQNRKSGIRTGQLEVSNAVDQALPIINTP